MPYVEVEIQVWCSCGAGLCGASTGGNGGVIVEPCERCLAADPNDRFDECYEEAQNE